MRKRSKLSSKKSKRMFSKHAVKVNSKNLRANPMRGGYRV
nr:MAG: hypothetical protein [Microvirus sp.]